MSLVQWQFDVTLGAAKGLVSLDYAATFSRRNLHQVRGTLTVESVVILKSVECGIHAIS